MPAAISSDVFTYSPVIGNSEMAQHVSALTLFSNGNFGLVFGYLLNHGIVLANGQEIENFLITNPSIVEYLLQLPGALVPFSASSRFALSVTSHFEENGTSYKYLSLNIKTDKKIPDSIKTLDQVESTWLFPNFDKGLKYFQFELSFG